MAIIYVTSGAWGSGTGAPVSAAQVDGNFYNLDQRVVSLNADLAEGKRIDTVTYTSNSMTFHFTDGTTQVIPLPIAQLTFVGEWLNSTTYVRGNMISARGLGIFQVLVDHTTPPPPATFDPNATDGTTDNNPLYQLWMPLSDVNYDAAIFVPGSVQRVANELLFEGIANRTMKLLAGNAHAYAHLDVAIASGGTDIIIAVQKNGVQIGTVTFTVAGGQTGSISIAADTDFAEGDRYGIRVTQSNNAEPSGLSITLPFLRMDI
jgi:hypothetical protein